MDDGGPVLHVRDVVKDYGGVRALDGVTLTLDRGEVHCLAGENGSGKSTLIKIISGVERPDAGGLVVDGEEVARQTPSGAIGAGIQVIYQDFSLFPNLSAGENIAMLGELAGGRRTFSRRRARRSAERVVTELGLDLDLDADVHDLSLADRQLVAICRALVGEVRVLIMDEPTTALTHHEVQRLFSIVRRLQARGVAVVFVSHKLDEVLAISQRVTVLRNGSVVAAGPASDFTARSIAQAMTGRDVDEERRVGALQPGAPPLLSVDGLGRRGAFSNVDFSLMPGEFLGIAGLLGSGRTEIAEALFGIAPADEGTVTINGTERRICSVPDAVRAGIGYVPEDRLAQGLFLDASIAENVVAATLTSYRRRSGLLDRARMMRSVGESFTRLRIKAPHAMAPVRSLSGGNAQRVVIAKWLDSDPAVLVLNGPTVGVDIGSKEDIFAILRIRASTGTGMVLISDDLPELVAHCHHVLVMRSGRITARLSGEDITVDTIRQRMTA